MSKSSPGPPSPTVSSRIRSRPRKPAWPSLVWNTSGAGAPVSRRVGAQRADAADAEQQLLAQPVLAGAAVQAVGDLAVVRRGCSSTSESSSSSGTRPTLATQIWATRSRPPGISIETRRARRRRPRAAATAAARRGRGPGRLLLPALAGQRLLEVAVPVEQTDADHRHAEVAGGLEVVAGEDAETAGVLRQHRGDAVLRREVGDRRADASVPPGAGTSGRRSGTASRSALAASRRATKPSSPASSVQRARPTAPRRRTGSWSTASQARRPRTRRRPASGGARTTAGCPPGRPAARAPQAGQDGR